MSFPPLSGRFSVWLKQYREQTLDITQKQLARMIGCAVTSIESYEQDRILPSKEMAARIARVIDYPDVDAFVIFARQGRPFRRTARTPDLPLASGAVASLPSALPEVDSWSILIDEQFKHNQNRWGLGLKDDGTGFITRSMVNGAYCLMLQPKHPNGCFLGGDSAIIAPERFYLTVEVEKVEGPSDAMAGIYFEELHDSQQIVFHARFSERVFAIASLQHGGNDITRFVPWTDRPDVIHPTINTFGLLAQQERFTFFINGVEVASAEIARIPGARVDVGIGGVAFHQRIVSLYRNFVLRVPTT